MFALDKLTAQIDETAITEIIRFTVTEITAIKAMLIRGNINTISSKVSSAAIRMDTTVAINMDRTTTARSTF